MEKYPKIYVYFHNSLSLLVYFIGIRLISSRTIVVQELDCKVLRLYLIRNSYFIIAILFDK